MVRASFGRRGGGGDGQKRPSTTSHGGPSPKSSRGSYQGSKLRESTREGGFRDNQESISDSASARREGHYVESKQSYRREDHHQMQPPSGRRGNDFTDLHNPQSQRYQASSSNHQYQNDSRTQYDQLSSMNSNIHAKSSSYDYGHDRYHNQRDYRAQERNDHSRDHHVQSSSSHGSGHRRTPPRESNRSGDNSFFRETNFNSESSYGQRIIESSSRKTSPPRSSYPAQRSGHSPRRLDERRIHSDYISRPRTPPESQGRARSPRVRGHSPRARTPTHHAYSRPRTPLGPRTPTGPQTPQRLERLHRSRTPQRQRSPHRYDGSHRQRSPQHIRSPVRMRSPQLPRMSQRQRTPPRNRSPIRPRIPRSPQRQRKSPSPKSRQDSSRSTKPRPYRSPRAPSPGAKSDRDVSRRDMGRHQASPTNRESALRRLGPRMNVTQRLGASQGPSQSFGSQNKTDRENPSSKSLLLTLKCPYCEFSVKSFRSYRVHENSKEHLDSVSKAVEKLEENIKNLRAKQFEEVALAKSEQSKATEEEKDKGEFCETCQVKYNQTTAEHKSSILHNSILEAINPECTICNEKFESSESFAKHLSVFYHVKKKATASGASHKDENPSDENDQDENYYLLDEIEHTDIEKLDLSKEPMKADDNLWTAANEAELLEDTEKDDGKHIEIKRMRKNAVVEPIMEEPVKGPVGLNFIRKVEMYFCDLCHKYLPRGHGDCEELINSHCVTQLHREKYEKEAQVSQAQLPEPDDKLEVEAQKITEVIKDDSAFDEQNVADQAQSPLEDQDEDDTLIIDNQTDL